MTAPSLINEKYYIVVPYAATNYVKNPRHDTPQGITGCVDHLGAQTKLALESTIQRRGAYSCKLTPTASTLSYVYIGDMPVTDGHSYTFSVDVLCETADEPLTITVTNAAATVKGTTAFTSTGYWQRKSVTITADATISDWRIYVNRLATSANTYPVYVDGWQFEEGTEATTFIHGYAGGFSSGEREYYWEGAARNSYSTRTDRTRHGGKLLDISTYAKIIKVVGLGMGQYEQIMTSMASGGSLYQDHIRKPRNFSLLLAYDGANQGELQAKRNVILDAVRPDVLPGQPMVIRYQGFDASGAEATNPVDIVCVPQPSHVDTPDMPMFNKDILTFTIPDGLLYGAFEEGQLMQLYEEIAVEHIVKRDHHGQWSNLGGGLNGIVWCMIEAPNGDIYVGGAFTDAGGVAAADYVAKWSKVNQAWEAVGNPNSGTGVSFTAVYALAFDAAGNLYMGGNFINVQGVAAADYIAKFDGTNWTALGTGIACDHAAKQVYDLIFDASGNLYVGGNFDSAGGVANTSGIAKWNGTVWSALGTGIAVSHTPDVGVRKMAISPTGRLYIGGPFANAGGVATADHLAMWDGTAWSPVIPGYDSLSTYALAFDAKGDLYIGGADVGGTNVGIIKWNGTSYKELGEGISDPVYTIAVDSRRRDKSGGTVFVGGSFTETGGLYIANRVAVWKSGIWNMLDIDLPGSEIVRVAFITRSGDLYIGGDFSTVGETPDENAKTGKVAVNVIPTESSANVYPFMQIHGPGTLQSIINYKTQKSIQFNDLTLNTGEWINLWLDPTNLKMTGGWLGRGNVLRYVIAGSDHGSFYLEPGTNYLSVLMPSGTDGSGSRTGGVLDAGNSEMFTYWKPRYWSIEGAKYT